MNQWLHPGAMSAHNCPHKDHTTLITSLVTCCADKIRFFKGWSSPLRPLCTLHVPPKATQACPVIFRLLILTDGYNCYSDGFLHFFCYLFCQLHSLVTRSVQLLACTPTTPVAISPAFQQRYHPLQIVRKLSCRKVCNREQTMHKQTEIPWLHWNPYSRFHSFWWAHCLWQRNLLSSALSGY